jgi:hypothetical protein
MLMRKLLPAGCRVLSVYMLEDHAVQQRQAGSHATTLVFNRHCPHGAMAAEVFIGCCMWNAKVVFAGLSTSVLMYTTVVQNCCCNTDVCWYGIHARALMPGNEWYYVREGCVCK